MTGPVISGLSSEIYKKRCNMNEEIKAVADRLIGLREICRYGCRTLIV